MRQKRIVTIQDLSCLGKCSLGVALPVISALGIETVVLPTAILSTHTGEFKDYTFCDLTEEMPKISRHWQKLALEFDAIYVGYLGSIRQMEIVEKFIDTFKGENTTVFIDPVMADNGVLYDGFTKEFVNEMLRLIKRADVICPNVTEACFLSGTEYKKDSYDESYIQEILEKLSKICKKTIITSVSYKEKGCGAVTMEDGIIKEVFRENIDGHFYGAGDLFASAFIGEFTRNGDFLKAINLSADFVTESIKKTLDEKERLWYGLKFEQALDVLINNK